MWGFNAAIVVGILYPPGPGERVFLIPSLYGDEPKPYEGAVFLSVKFFA